MKRRITIVFLLIISMMLNSCAFGGGRMFFDNDDSIADKRLEQVVKAIQNRDKKALKSMFSKEALAKSDDFDGHMDYLITFYQGKLKSYDNGGGLLVNGDIEHGKKTKEVVSAYTVKTSIRIYMFFLIDYPVDTIHPDNVGLYTLRVTTPKDAEADSSSWQDRKIPGIYKPKK